ncbi:cytochrome P450 [Streptomyces sp. NPDC001709]
MLDTIDVADPELYATGDPVGVWSHLRATTPVYWNASSPGPGFWAVMSYGPALQVYRATETFTSQQGMRLGSDPAAVAAAAGKMLIVTDPPVHQRLRRLMSSAFTPRMVSGLEATMQSVIEPLVDEAVQEGTVDFVSRIAAVLPAATICAIMDVPSSERSTMIELTSTAFGASVGGTGQCPIDQAARAEAHSEIFFYYSELVEQRRQEPGDDVISALLRGRLGDRPLTDEEILLNCDGLLTGANETTRHASAAGLLALIENPDQWQRLRDGAVGVDSAVEELLRYTSPAMHVMRVATKDTELGGHQVRAGDRVAVWNSSANRDADVFANPDALDLGRAPNRHLAFGVGPHFCLGAALARAELRVLLRTLLDRVSHVELAGPVRRLRSNFVWGIEHLPVSLG